MRTLKLQDDNLRIIAFKNRDLRPNELGLTQIRLIGTTLG